MVSSMDQCLYQRFSGAAIAREKTAADLCVKKHTDSHEVPLFTQVKCYKSVSFCRINAGDNSGELLLVLQVSLTSNHDSLGLRRSRSVQ